MVYVLSRCVIADRMEEAKAHQVVKPLNSLGENVNSYNCKPVLLQKYYCITEPNLGKI